MTAAANDHIATADELAEALVTQRLETYDNIKIRYDRRLLAPYGVDPDERAIVLPWGLDWREKHSRINRTWLYFMGGADLAPEFAPVRPDHPDRRIVSSATVPGLRRVW